MTESTTTPKPQIEQLADSFGLTTGKFLEGAQNEVELAKAAGNREELIKAQIKLEVVRQTRNIFVHNYKRITGSDPWSEGSHG